MRVETARDTSPPAQGAVAPLLSVRHVTRRFRTRRHDTVALADVSLDVHEGEFVCVVGPSGCGKSTLLNLLAGLDRPDAGTVAFAGRPVLGPGPDRVVVFQEPALYPWLNVRANVEFGLRLQRLPRPVRRARVDRYLELVRLSRFQRAWVHELSGGMKQRVQLARALAVEPRVLLMDEPFAALDAQTRDALQAELQEIWARTGCTIVFVTHNVREAAILADRVLVLTPGPGQLQRELPVPLPRPRQPDDHAVADLAATIRAELARGGGAQ
ncbi:MAG TPA: ABC transporter ATP-binding protein [Dehalococcoidia bacterium]